jgi:putative transposase
MSFIDAHDSPAGLVLRVLDIPTSTYYDWGARQTSPSRRELDDAALLEQIVKIRAAHEFAACRCRWGAPRLAAWGTAVRSSWLEFAPAARVC